MGSLRNPIGPLPSSIYWRRRAVALAFLILVLLLAIWAFGWGGSGGGGGKDEGKGSGGGGAASTITPGPTSSTPVNSQRPGGRDESDDAGTGGDDTGGADSGGSGDGTDTGGAGGDGSAAGSDGDGDGGGTGGSLGIGDGQSVPAGSSLAACTPGAVELTVRSVKDSRVKNTYEPGEEPTFEIIVKNSSDTACKVDFGRAAASLTITDAENDHVWASDDCPKGSKSVLVEVAGKGQTKRTVDWDRKRSAEDCAKPSGDASAKPGTYLVEAKVEGLGTARVSFVLNKG
ncbi:MULTISPECIES: hypothetical protein [unclassified Streptomyces]|uniref:hypothetical protein n=1 Tax=unclassified Streptomyces TaxID=2593676 RepID=UPI0033C404D6